MGLVGCPILCSDWSRPSSAHPCPRDSPLPARARVRSANSRRRPQQQQRTADHATSATLSEGAFRIRIRPEPTWTAASTKRRSLPPSGGSASWPSAPPQTRRRRGILPRRPRGASSRTLNSRGTRPHPCARPRPNGSTTTPTPPPPSLPPTPAAPQIPPGPTSVRALPPATPRLRRLTVRTTTLHAPTSLCYPSFLFSLLMSVVGLGLHIRCTILSLHTHD
jgi:hypothetical protein